MAKTIFEWTWFFFNVTGSLGKATGIKPSPSQPPL